MEKTFKTVGVSYADAELSIMVLRNQLADAVARGIIKLGWDPDVPASTGNTEFEGRSHECLTIADAIINSRLWADRKNCCADKIERMQSIINKITDYSVSPETLFDMELQQRKLNMCKEQRNYYICSYFEEHEIGDELREEVAKEIKKLDQYLKDLEEK